MVSSFYMVFWVLKFFPISILMFFIAYVPSTANNFQPLELVHKESLSAAAAAAKSLQSCPTLCDPIDGSPSGSSVPGILQARTLEWVAMSLSNA